MMSNRSNPEGSQLSEQPGLKSYAKTVGALRRVVHAFKTEPASRQTAKGVADGVKRAGFATKTLPQSALFAGIKRVDTDRDSISSISWGRNRKEPDEGNKVDEESFSRFFLQASINSISSNGWGRNQEEKNKVDKEESISRFSCQASIQKLVLVKKNPRWARDLSIGLRGKGETDDDIAEEKEIRYPTGRVSPMPDGFHGGPVYPTGRVSPMPDGCPGYPTGRVSTPGLGGSGYPMGRVSPRPMYPDTGRVSPMPSGLLQARTLPGPYWSGKCNPRLGGGGRPRGPVYVYPTGEVDAIFAAFSDPRLASPSGQNDSTLASPRPDIKQRALAPSAPLPPTGGPCRGSTKPAKDGESPNPVVFSPNVPNGHVATTQSIFGFQPSERCHSPNPTNPEGGQDFSRSTPIGMMHLNPELPASGALLTPELFDRPINKTLLFTTFDRFKVQDLEDFYDRPLVRLPKILTTHDILSPDWDRFMGDIAAAWVGRFPIPNQTGKTPKPSSLVADLVELWNQSFFQPRGIELELYRGRELRTGRNAGHWEFRLPRVEAYDSDSSDVSDDESDSEPDVQSVGLFKGVWCRPERYNSEAEQERKQRTAERRRADERKQREKEEQKRYKLYVSATAPAGRGVHGS